MRCEPRAASRASEEPASPMRCEPRAVLLGELGASIPDAVRTLAAMLWSAGQSPAPPPLPNGA
jgi:hypothetical protein